MLGRGICEKCGIDSINLNYVITPQKESNPVHSKLCPQCTAKHMDEFLSTDNKESMKVNC